MADTDPDTAEKTVRGLLDARITAIRELATRRADLTHARYTLAAAGTGRHHRLGCSGESRLERHRNSATSGSLHPDAEAPGRPRSRSSALAE